MPMYPEGRFYSLLGGLRDHRQRPRATKRESDNIRDRAENIVRNINEAEGMVIEARERKFNSRAKAVGGINKEIGDLGKEL